MGKILFWFVVIVVILFGARLLARSGGSGGQQKPTGKLGKAASPPDMSHAESMVRCAHCGIYMPRSEAFLSDGRTWCGAQHAKLGQRQP